MSNAGSASLSLTPTAREAKAVDALARVFGYHEATKHQLERYARGPETLDWDEQPAPFRHFSGAPVVPLPRFPNSDALLGPEFLEHAPAVGAGRPMQFSLARLGALLALSLGITAWKSQGPDRWAVRANPSSGNLHPVEGYLLVAGAPFLGPGVYHYRPDEHALEQRAHWDEPAPSAPRIWLALTSVQWREAWKYGERAFRYCQLDVGHAVAALAQAAALFGWHAREQNQLGSLALQRMLGLDRGSDFPHARRPDTEREEPEILLELETAPDTSGWAAAEFLSRAAAARFAGQASMIDPRPMYSWPSVGEVAQATRFPDSASACTSRLRPAELAALPAGRRTVELILRRRSAQRFDGKFTLPRAAFVDLLHALLPRTQTNIDLVLFVHRVDGLTPGVYLFSRSVNPERSLLGWLERSFELHPMTEFEPSGRLFEVATLPPRELARRTRMLHCHQDIAANCCFVVGMMADLEQAITEPPVYRRLLREAGSLGQVLYLQAEAAGLRGTGIGCFFDDAIAESLGLRRSPVRSLYHFSVGRGVEDPRMEITTKIPCFAVGDSPDD